MGVVSGMTTLPIATQRPMYDYVGRMGCQFYWGLNIAFQTVMINSGIGMAIYRLTCFHYVFKRELNKHKIAKYVLLGELAIGLVMISLSVLLFTFFGWENALFYQFCMNLRTSEADILHKYTQQNHDFNQSHLKLLRYVFNSFGQFLFIAEFAIYAWILFNLWKHDQRNHSEGIITEPMKKERNQKNAITLYGQVMSFLVESAFNVYMLVHYSNLDIFEASFLPISQILASTVISAIQLATSHEMRRFLKNQFNLY